MADEVICAQSADFLPESSGHKKSKDPLGFILKSVDKLNKEKCPVYVFGGWVRDTIRNETPNDMDISIGNSTVAKNYIVMLGVFDLIVEKSEKPNKYSAEKLVLELRGGKKLKLDIVIPNNRQGNEDNVNLCDFTCNNLAINLKGQIFTRVPPPRSRGEMSSSQWTLQCMRDALFGNLVWMIDPRKVAPVGSESYVEYVFKMKSRLDKMLSRGYKDSGKSLTSFRLSYICTHLDVPFGKEVSTECSICSAGYSEEPEKRTIILKCGHDFHYECLRKHSTKPNASCPYCRQKIEYSVRY